MTIWQKWLAEWLGSIALLATVVGSGIMGVNLAAGNTGIALLANAGATAGILYVLITCLGPLSGAHFNPAVTLVFWLRGEMRVGEVFGYFFAQTSGAIIGVLLAHAMFDLPLWQPGDQIRSGGAQWLSEAIAIFGLVMTILLGVRHRAQHVPALVASYIFAAYWFTASTSFANPAVTIARCLTQTFAGIAPTDVLGFIASQIVGALLALALVRISKIG